MKTFSMMVLGCKVNDYEATYVKNELLNEYQYVSFKEKADIVIIFSCCVTNTAESKTRKFIHNAINNNPNAYIVVVGCLAQIKPNLNEFKNVNLVIGSTNKNEIVDLIRNGINENKVKELKDVVFEELLINNYPGKSRAFLKIQDGCNQFCSYCIIPYARGNERSCKHETILKEAATLSKEYKEVVLTGIHTGRYNDNGYNLYNLLSDLVKIDSLKTIRLSSIEINELNDEIIDLMANNSKIARHLHIPVQACSNEILMLMNRPYTIENYISRIEYIRNKVKDISISTDLIVGFPNESDDIFNKSLVNLDKINFSFIHIFKYSRKSNTKADKMTNHIDESVKKNRSKIIEDKQKLWTSKFLNNFVDKEVDVLIEKNEDGYSYGYASQYFYVKVKGLFKIGDIIKVKVISINDNIIGEYAS